MNSTYVVVMGRNYTSLLGMIRSVGEAGCTVGVIRTIRDSRMKVPTLDAFSKYVNKYTYAIEPDRQNLIDVIKEEFMNIASNVVLMPTDDFTASAIDELSEQLQENFLFPHVIGKSGSLTLLMDKDKQKELANQVGLATAKSWSILVSPTGFVLPESIQYPCFTKPQISLAGNKSYMKKCDNEQQLCALMKKIQESINTDCPILIEQYLEIEREYAIQGCCLDQNVIIPGIIKKIRTASGTHKGVTAIGEVIGTSEFVDTIEKLKDFMQKMHFVGVFDIEIIESRGVVHYNELNLRSGAYGYAITGAGCNLPKILIKYLIGESGFKADVVIPNRVFVSEKVDIEDFEEGYINYKTYKNDISKAHFSLIKNDADKAPYKEFSKVVVKKRIKRLVKSVRRRLHR